MVALTGSLLLFAQMGTHETFWNLLPAMILGGFGMSAAMAPVTAAAMSAVRPDKAGVGSAVLNSMRQVGGSLGIAIMGAVVAAGVSSALSSGDPRPVAFVHGFHHALEIAAAITAVGALLALATLRKAPHTEHAEQPVFVEAA
jgi:MFS family permease